MKTKLILTAVAVLLSGILLGAVGAQYQKYTSLKTQAEKTAAQNQANRDNQKQAEINGLKVRVEQLQTECQKGVTAYGLLPLTTRTKTAQPSCGEVL